MLPNDLSLPSDLKRRKAGERNLSLPPIGCPGKVSGPVTCSGRKRGSWRPHICIPMGSPSFMLSNSVSHANVWYRFGGGCKGEKETYSSFWEHVFLELERLLEAKPSIDAGNTEASLEEVTFEPS